jgi:hypothetical protein
VQESKYSEEALERERDALAKALERLANVQRELAMGQHELMAGQKTLADQQDKLVHFLDAPFDNEEHEPDDQTDQPGGASQSESSPVQVFNGSDSRVRDSQVAWRGHEPSDSEGQEH